MPIPITIVGREPKPSRTINDLLQENEQYRSQLRQIDDAVEQMNDQPLVAYERLKKILSEVHW